MSIWLAIGLGGAVGAMARYGVGRLVYSVWPLQGFPLATLIVNVTGCVESSGAALAAFLY
jgi:CrcB protein